MASTLASNTKGRNVEPLSSVLDINTLSADVSGFSTPPLDGEWVFFKGDGKPADNTLAELTIDGTNNGTGALLCMVWSEKGRSDLQSLSRRKVPVIFRKSLHCKLHLYNYDPAVSLPAPGALITVKECASDIEGDSGTTRMVADVTDLHGATGLSDWSAGSLWIVGYVIGGPGSLGGSGSAGDALEVYLYDSPRMVTKHA